MWGWALALLAAALLAAHLQARWRLGRLRRAGLYPKPEWCTHADIVRLVQNGLPAYAVRCYREAFGASLPVARMEVAKIARNAAPTEPGGMSKSSEEAVEYALQFGVTGYGDPDGLLTSLTMAGDKLIEAAERCPPEDLVQLAPPSVLRAMREWLQALPERLEDYVVVGGAVYKPGTFAGLTPEQARQKRKQAQMASNRIRFVTRWTLRNEIDHPRKPKGRTQRCLAVIESRSKSHRPPEGDAGGEPSLVRHPAAMDSRLVLELMRQHFPALRVAARHWVVAADAQGARVGVLQDLLSRHLAGEHLLVDVNFSTGHFLPVEAALELVAQHIGQGFIRLTNRGFTGFVVVAPNGAATGWSVNARVG